MQTFLSDPQNIQQYHNEYLKLLNFYQNTKKPAAFVKYYNINNSISIQEEDLNSTYDIYSHSEVRFDVYDLTPTNYILPITNTTASVNDLAGQMYDGIESLVIYTIKKPRIHDIIGFYSPIMSEEHFRVSSIRTQVNALHSETSLDWFELQLEYAPVGDISGIKIEKEYVYDLSSETYMLKNDYQKYILSLDRLKDSLDKIKLFYSTIYDLYMVDNFIPIEVNELIIFIKEKFSKKYKDIFTDIKKPYGYIDKYSLTYENIDSLPFTNFQNYYKFYNMNDNTIQDYFWDKNDIINNQLDEILLLSLNIFVENNL